MYKQIAELYHSLEDEQSRHIFLNRFLYGLTGDKKYILEIALPFFCQCGKSWDDAAGLADYLGDKELVVFGAGGQGAAIGGVLEVMGIQIDYFCDNSPAKVGQLFHNKKVLSADELCSEHRKAQVLIATVEFQQQILEQLGAMGYPKEQIIYFDNGGHEQYFDKEIMTPIGEREIFADAGCYNGESSIEFCRWAGMAEKQVYAFEPDSRNYVTCDKNLQEKLGGQGIEYKLYPAGLWSRSTSISFADNHNSGSRILEKGENRVQVVSLDDLLKGEAVTFLKMDIEGAELAALEGARQTIQTYKPKLAICLYHKPEDITEIPAYIRKLVPEYRLWIRHYSLCENETVLYAVP